MPEEIYCIYDVLDEMRAKPAMYLGVKSVIRLEAFLQGYDHALRSRGVRRRCRPEFFPEFHDWVADRLGYGESTAGWCKIILAEVLGWSPSPTRWGELAEAVRPADDAAALDRFYWLLDQYRRERAA